MSHEITVRKDGRAEFAYVGEKPWHGLGTRIGDGPAKLEDILAAAGLGWTVSKRELITCDGIPVTEHVATVRDDNKVVLGCVGKDYELIQNVQAASIMEAIIGTGEAHYETAGSLFGGKRIFIVAKLPEVLRAGQKDISEQYLTLAEAHDATMSLRVYFTAVRVVCNNTLQLSMRGMKNCVSIRHSGSIDEKIEIAQETLGMARKYFATYQQIVDKLTAKLVDKEMVEAFLKDVFEIGKKPVIVNAEEELEKDKVSKVKERQMGEVKDIFRNDAKNNLQGIGGSAWALLNSAVQWVDHHRKYDSADERMSSLFFGPGMVIKQRAMESILTLTK